jgi:uncharacterized membrane-anchored protein YjiN (DUF445 family)
MADGEQRAQWMAMRRMATGLLLLMGLLLLVMHRLQSQSSAWSPVWPYVAAFAEAALVGGLADWFAVTALFRRPLGLPIPHTAILPTHKNRLADSIAGFIGQNFFTAGVVADELARVDFAAIITDWLGHRRRRRWLARHVLQGMASAASVAGDLQVRQSLKALIAVLVTPQRLSIAAAALFAAMLAQQRHMLLYDRTLVIVSGLLGENQWQIHEKVDEKTPGWMPRYLKDEIFRRLMSGLDELLEDMRQPDSPWRDGFTASLQAQIDQITEADATGQGLRAHLSALLSEPAVVATASRLWESVLADLKEGGSSSQSLLLSRADDVIAALAAAFSRDAASREWLNRQLQSRLTQAMIARRSRILDVIRRVMHRWDAPTVANTIEAYVGRDLQYIRMNGTLVGGMVGLILHILQVLF